jgi:hypothetical protein
LIALPFAMTTVAVALTVLGPYPSGRRRGGVLYDTSGYRSTFAVTRPRSVRRRSWQD